MQISNDDIARILGRIEAKLDAQGESSRRQEAALISLENKLSERADEHEERIRALEVANPADLASKVNAHEERLRALEKSSAKAGMIGGIGAGIGTAVLVELIKRKIGF